VLAQCSRGVPETPLTRTRADSRFGEEIGLLFRRVRYVRKIERLASFCQRDPRIPQACIMFALLGIVCFLRQRCAPGGGFPCGLALGSHLVLSISTTSPLNHYVATHPESAASCCLSLFLADEKFAEPLRGP
jgi:hypothetical protein